MSKADKAHDALRTLATLMEANGCPSRLSARYSRPLLRRGWAEVAGSNAVYGTGTRAIRYRLTAAGRKELDK